MKVISVIILLLTFTTLTKSIELPATSQAQEESEIAETNLVIKQFLKREKKKYNAPIDVNRAIKGDINNDGIEDQLIEYNVNIGYPGNASLSFIAVFLSTNGQLKFQSKMDSGTFGTATGEQVTLDKIVDGIVYCKVYEYAPNDGVCCPSIEKSYSYKLVNRKFKLIHK